MRPDGRSSRGAGVRFTHPDDASERDAGTVESYLG
jgi:hypothetical protein